ncbi:MAG: LytTR family DNA-binding domain-containing protein [Flavobacteriaceae bacterium]
MIRTHFIAIFIAFGLNKNISVAQNDSNKSIEIKQSEHQSDSLTASNLLDLANYYYNQEFNIDSLYSIANRAILISKPKKLHTITSRCYSAKAIANLHRENFELVKIDLDSAVHYANIAKDLKQLEKTQLLLAGYYTAKKEADKAVETLMSVLKNAENNMDVIGQASVYYRLIDIYAKENNKEKIKENLDRLSKIIKTYPEEVPVQIQIYVLETYLTYFQKQSTIESQNIELQDSLNHYYQKGLAYTKENQLVQNEGSLHSIMAIYYINKDQFLEAETFCRKALKFKPYLDKVSLQNIYSALSYVSLYKRKDKDMVKYLDTLLNHIPITTLTDSINVNHVAYEINFALRNYEISQKYRALELQLKEKEENLKQTKIIEELQLKYETEKKDAIIKAQAIEKEELKNRAKINYLLFGLGFLGLLVFVVGYYFFTKNKSLAVKLDLEQTKAALLQSKLNPNFHPKENGGNGNGKSVDKLLVKSQDISELVNINEIIRCEADGTYAKIITTKKTLLSSKNLKYHEDLLTKHNFIRVHNSHLVNVDYIQSFNRQIQDGMQLINGDKIPVSARKKKEISEFLDTLS